MILKTGQYVFTIGRPGLGYLKCLMSQDARLIKERRISIGSCCRFRDAAMRFAAQP